MLRIVVSRALWSVPLLFVVSIFTFVLVSLTPGDPARTILGVNGTPQQYQALRQALGLNKPLWEQYWEWLSKALGGDLGRSLFTGQPVTTLLDTRLVVSLTLIIGSTLIATLFGIFLGILAALRGGAMGATIEAVGKIGLALPNFIIGLIFVYVFAVTLHAFPATGFVFFSTSPSLWLQSLVLPVATLALAGTTLIAAQTRQSMLETLNLDFVRVLEANGFTRRSIVYRHALRSAAIPIISMVSVVFIGLLSGTVLVETIFALPGLGSYAVQVTEQHDIPVVQGIALYFTVVVVIVNFATDLLYGWLNPQVRAA